MDMDFINKMSDIHSFVELHEIFKSWINEGVITDRAEEIMLGYSSLIAYPSIYLTKDGSGKEIAAAKECHEIMMKYSKDSLNRLVESHDEKTQLSSALLIMPPEKAILSLCSEFFNLNYLLKGLFSNYTDEQLANVNGDDYAKVWLSILSKGYHFEETERDIEYDRNHWNESYILISKMQLSPMYKDEMNIDKIKQRLETYYKQNNSGNSGSGCVVLILLFFMSTLFVACSL